MCVASVMVDWSSAALRRASSSFPSSIVNLSSASVSPSNGCISTGDGLSCDDLADDASIVVVPGGLVIWTGDGIVTNGGGGTERVILGDITQSLCMVVTVAIEHGIEVFNGANRSAGPVVPAIVEFDFSTIDALGVPAIEEPGVPFETIGDGATVDTVDPDVFIAVDVIVGGTNVVSADISVVTGTVTIGVVTGGTVNTVVVTGGTVTV